ncbi:MAG: TonB-dependent receptor [Xanthomonadales bacterium]|nr:TonB-dependent receptor [Xanthomonadales bacterium]
MNVTQRCFTALVTALPLCAMASADDTSNATEIEAGPLEEVVVSAFRRATTVELDSSITVLGEETIRAAALQHFEEMIALVPNMNWSGDGARARYFQLRGVGELEQYEGAPNPSVGFIVDDIDLSGVGGISSVFDMAQAEVLRGPQATRFGASALAGLVYLQSAEPSNETEVIAELLAGNAGTLGAGVAAGGALGDSVNGRFSVHHYRDDGFYDNVYLGRDDTNERNETTARGKLLWDLGSDWQAKLSVLYTDFDNGYDAWSPENGRIVFSDNPGRDEQQTAGASFKLSGPLGAGTEFVSITGFADTEVYFSFDGEWGNNDYWAPFGYDYVYWDARERRSMTQEFRLLSAPGHELLDGRTSWVVGGYASSLDESDDILSAGVYDDGDWCTPCASDTFLMSDYDSSNLALFGRLDSKLSDRLSLNTGLRLERWSADYRDEFTDRLSPGTPQPGNDFDPSETLWGGDVSLNVLLDDGSHVYARLSRGYKAGGFNPSAARALASTTIPGAGLVSFDPETLLNAEIGFKGLWMDDRLAAEAAAFWMDRKNMQVRSSAQYTDNPNDFIFITSNAEGHAYGVEASLGWQLTGNWRLHGALGLLESKIDEYRLPREQDIDGKLEGRAFAHAPRYNLSAGATWATPAGWLARLDINAMDGFYFDYSHDEKAASRVIVNLKAGKTWGRWSLHAWVRNLLDEDYATRGFSFGLAPPLFERTRYTRLGDPRHYGLTLGYHY